jgi:hypothetical protein
MGLNHNGGPFCIHLQFEIETGETGNIMQQTNKTHEMKTAPYDECRSMERMNQSVSSKNNQSLKIIMACFMAESQFMLSILPITPHSDL